MRVSGVTISFLDIPAGTDAAFAQWCDHDHVPEIVSLPAVAAGRRYFASPDLLARRASQGHVLDGGKGRYCSTYLLSGDLDVARAQIAERAKALIAAGRTFPGREVVFSKMYRLTGVYKSSRVEVGDEAVPYLGHQGIQVAFGEVTNPANARTATAWWDEFHYPDMLSVPGWLAALKFEPVGEEGLGKFMHLFLLDRPPEEAHVELQKVVQGWRRAGRSPSPNGIYRRSIAAPFALVTPNGTAR